MAVIQRTHRIDVRLDELDEDEKIVAASKLAGACYDMSELLLDGSRLYDDIVCLDQNFRFDDSCTEELFHKIKGFFVKWHTVVGRVLASFGEMRGNYVEHGFEISRFDDLKLRFVECDAALNPCDDETDLADEAIEEHRAGRTIPM